MKPSKLLFLNEETGNFEDPEADLKEMSDCVDRINELTRQICQNEIDLQERIKKILNAPIVRKGEWDD